MSKTLEQFISAMYHAIRTHSDVHIAGSDFSPAEIAEIVAELEVLIPKESK